jgi:LuxR family maltose regulon positive regulatory protein
VVARKLPRKNRSMASTARKHSSPPHTAAGESDSLPLAEAMLAIPSIRPGVVERSRIRAALHAPSDAALTLVAAPVGYGKTTAVREWCSHLDAALAWITLDPGADDPGRLWRYVATAIDRVREGLGRTALQRLSAVGASVEGVVDDLLNGAAAYGSPLIVVLDDLHEVTDGDCLASIDYAISHLPSNVRLILISRADPPLQLARLRASGTLVEVRTEELAFTFAEAKELLVAKGGLALGDDEIQLLMQVTEGWPAAVVLAGLWLKTVPDPASSVRAFGGGHRFVADYLSSEVIEALDEDHRSFLHGAAVLGEFTPGLCDAVLARNDSAAVLAELEQANLFVMRLERGGWYRLHSLFAEYARAHLAAQDPAAATRVHRAAAEWLRAKRLPAEAMTHASAAGDHELVAELLGEHDIAMIRHGLSRVVLRWVRSLPLDVIEAHPALAASAALADLVVGGNARERRRYLQVADRELLAAAGSEPYLELETLLVHAFAMDDGVAQAVCDGRRAVELARERLDEAGPGANASYARALYFAGDLDEASDAAVRVIEHPTAEQSLPSLVVARTILALAAVERGLLASARTHAEEAKAVVHGIGSSRTWLGANASMALGAVLAAEGRLTEAEHELSRAEHLLSDEVPTIDHAWTLALLARVRLQRGRLDEADSAGRNLRDDLSELPDSGRLPTDAAAVKRELGRARDRATRAGAPEPPTEAELEVLRHLATDLSVREISERLFLSPNTIRSHRRALYLKFGVHTRYELIARATALGLLDQAHSPR